MKVYFKGWFTVLTLALGVLVIITLATQPARGNCSLMRWFGRAEALPSRVRAEEPARVAELDPEALVDIIRYSRDPQQRGKALWELQQRGMVEPL